MIKFNKEQEDIINNIFGAYLINAPVGTGKTTVLTERIVKAMDLGIRPDEILALTFTNRSAEEIKNRIKVRLEDKNIVDSLTIKTFHGFCAYFLKSESKNIGIESDFSIIDEDEQVEIVKNIFNKTRKVYPDNNRELLNILDSYYKYRLSLLQIELGHKIKTHPINPEIVLIGEEYLESLRQQNLLDFNELVLLSLKTMYLNPDVNNRWSDRFKFIELDEFQDTHMSEYLLIKELAKKHKNISLIGDIDQTIYSFRDSQPFFLTELFKKHFAPVKELGLSINYRSNPGLINSFLSVLENMEKAQTKSMKSEQKKQSEEKIQLFRAHNFNEEIIWLVDNIKKIKDQDPSAKIAVLNRWNKSIGKIALIFTSNNISFLTVDQYDFFKRQEVKDIFAYLKILFNKNDTFAIKRIMQRPPKNIGEKTLEKIEINKKNHYLNIADFLNFNNYNFIEPFSKLIEESEKGRMVVLDTETTGINPAQDDIVQIYAQEIIDGKKASSFHFYLKTKKSVGSSYLVHKISDDFLKEKGEDPRKVLKELKKFIGKSIIIGHNVLFDLNMIKENAKRCDIKFEFKNYYDTLDLSRRILSLDSYKLSNIAKHLNFTEATHSADDDVAATVELLLFLIKKLKNKQEERIDLWNKFKPKFIALGLSIGNWEKNIEKMRPGKLLEYLWLESGLDDYYQSEPHRLKSFKTLKDFFDSRDNQDMDTRTSLHNLIHFSGLVKNIDFLGLEQGKIPIVTIHQVKGLEFDYIFLPGLNEGMFPFFNSSNLEEEKRLFYVALTRARKKVFLSYSNFNDFNYPSSKSRLVSLIDDKFIEVV